MLNNDRFTTKHGTQNIQNDCHQWISDSFRVHQIRFWPRLRPGPYLGSLQRSTDSLACLRGPTSKGRRGKREMERGREGRDRPLLQIPGSAPDGGELPRGESRKSKEGWVKGLPGFRNLSYAERRNKLNLTTLELRRLHNDLVMCYKIMFNIIRQFLHVQHIFLYSWSSI